MTDDLETLLTAWMPQQRWFGGKGRPITSLHITEGDGFDGDGVRLLLAIVSIGYVDGGHADFQVPLAQRPEPWTDIEHALVGEDGTSWYYDAPHDPAAAALLLECLRTEATSGATTFHRVEEVAAGLRPRLVGAEQSNTSIVFGEEVIFKLFRPLVSGRNPDLELTMALHQQGSPHVAPVHGWYEGEVNGARTTLGMAQAFQRSASEGWQMATASVRDLFDEADLHAEEVGGDFAAEAHRLGAATAEVHHHLRLVLPATGADRDEIEETALQMHDRLHAALEEVSELAPFADALHAAYDAVAALPGPVAKQRIHGDLHLGQVLRTDHGWIVLDFEGEPARPLAERTALMSPLRDVAGMLRSFEYAARSMLADQLHQTALEYRAGEWAHRNREAFCDGYAEVAERDPRDDDVLLRAFELDKAVYEVLYEARFRPTWLSIPLGSIQRLVG